MAFFNYATMQMAAKIVYYGPGLCGKTTNLQYIYNKTAPRSRGEMVSLETESDRTLFFDLLPLEVGVIAGFKTRFQLYTVPGQVFYGETRKMVLKGVDGVVFVADSQAPVLDANIESWLDLEQNLKGMGLSPEQIPTVFQYNKRDLPTALPVAALQDALNRHGWPYFESSAVKGTGVFDTLKGISKLTLLSLTSKLERPSDPKVSIVDLAAQQRSAEAAVAAATAAISTPAAQPAATMAPEVEFATSRTMQSDQELAQTAPKVRTVSTAPGRVSLELDRIRESLMGPMAIPAARPKMKDFSPALEDLKRISASLVADAPTEVRAPKEMLDGLRSLEIRVKLIDGKSTWESDAPTKVMASKLTRTDDGWVLKISLLPKKS